MNPTLDVKYNRLILGDCLDVLKTLPDNSVDLCYIDPPFFSNRNYEVVWGDENESRSFQDRWSGGVDHYIDWLKERVIEIHRVLKSTGSFYLHCDWHADAYIRVYILDKIFGEKNFRNEIIWGYNVGGKPTNAFARKHDNIYFYTKSHSWHFNSKDIGIARDTGAKSHGGRMGTDEFGRIYQDKIVKKTGKIYRYYLEEGKIPEDWWVDINSLQSQSKERLGYPTQKPEKLLERIIKASSNPGDVVLDCFCGGGTTLAVADKLDRKWIGIDQSEQAIKVSGMRLKGIDNAKLQIHSSTNPPPMTPESTPLQQKLNHLKTACSANPLFAEARKPSSEPKKPSPLKGNYLYLLVYIIIYLMPSN